MANIDQVQLPDGSQYHIIDDTSGYATTTYVQNQISTINKNTIGLGNVDNTADINKPVSLPQQAALNGKVDDDIVAYVESDTTATKRHEVGDQFILNGVLYTATAIIAVNDTIVIGTNASLADSITTQIGNANSAISTLNTAVGTKANKADLTNLDLTGTTNTSGLTILSGYIFYLNGELVRAIANISDGATFTLNTNYENVTNGGLNNGGRIDILHELTVNTTDYTYLSGTKSWAYIANNVVNLHFTLYSLNGNFVYGSYAYPIQLPIKYAPKIANVVFNPGFAVAGGQAGTENTGIGYGTITTAGTVIVMASQGASGMNAVIIDISYPL